MMLCTYNLLMLERDECVDVDYCTTCRKHIRTHGLEAHLTSSKHRWNTQYRLREAAIERYLQFLRGEGRLCDYLPGHQQPTFEYFAQVSFRLLSGEIFAQLDVSMTWIGLLDCQNNLAYILEVHPALVKIEYTGRPPFAIGRDAYICRSDSADRIIDHCSLCYLYREYMTECLFCGAYVCAICIKCPNWAEGRYRCWGCMPLSAELTARDKARKLILGHCSLAQETTGH